jgi:nucleotide-binding universal stress UspA family protein
MKNMIAKILVPLDGSELAEQILPYARGFSSALKVPVELYGVDQPGREALYTPEGGLEDYLAKVRDRLSAEGISASHHVESGDPAQLIAARAGGDSGTMIVMATHGMSGIQRLFLGSVAYKVVHMAKNPMLLVRPVTEQDETKSFQLKSIFVPLDGSGLAEKILPFVISLAKSMKLDVVLIRAYTSPAQSFLVGDGVLLSGLQRIRDNVRQEIDTYLNGKVEQLQAEGLNRVSAIAVEGEGAEEIIDMARKTPDNLIAMSTHGRSGLERWTLGSVTEKVIHHSGDPVLIIRPA